MCVLCPCCVLSLCPDANTSQWSVQVDLTVDASQATVMLIVVSVPELDSQQSFQTRILPGKTKNTLTLNINMVLLPVFWFVWPEHACHSPLTLFFFHQSSSVRLWWPNGHGDQPGYRLTVTGFQDGVLVLETESKVREAALQLTLACVSDLPCECVFCEQLLSLTISPRCISAPSNSSRTRLSALQD